MTTIWNGTGASVSGEHALRRVHEREACLVPSTDLLVSICMTIVCNTQLY